MDAACRLSERIEVRMSAPDGPAAPAAGPAAAHVRQPALLANNDGR
jgi:hypothetical protein